MLSFQLCLVEPAEESKAEQCLGPVSSLGDAKCIVLRPSLCKPTSVSFTCHLCGCWSSSSRVIVMLQKGVFNKFLCIFYLFVQSVGRSVLHCVPSSAPPVLPFSPATRCPGCCSHVPCCPAVTPALHPALPPGCPSQSCPWLLLPWQGAAGSCSACPHESAGCPPQRVAQCHVSAGLLWPPVALSYLLGAF